MQTELTDYDKRDKKLKFGFLEKFKVWFLYKMPRLRIRLEPNIYFYKPDERSTLWYKQRKQHGWDERVTWNLCDDISTYLLPRLKLFRKYHGSYPGIFDTPEQWNNILDEIILGVEYSTKDLFDYQEEMRPFIEKKMKRAGLLLFKYYFDLWN